MNILFLTNNYPGFGGIERVTDILVNYLGKCHNIYSLSLKSIEGAAVPESLLQHFVFKSSDKTGKIEEYNHLIEFLNIDVVINQGMFPNNSQIVFNDSRNKKVRVISTLHSMPGYEKTDYIYAREQNVKQTYKNLIRRMLIHMGIHSGYNNCKKQHLTTYKKAAECGEIVLLSSSYVVPFIKEYSLQKYSSKISAIPNPLPYLLSEKSILQRDAKENLIIFVGRLSPEKRVDIILALWDRLCKTPCLKDIMQSWKLEIIGDGPCKGHLESIARSLKLKNCIFVGNTTEVQIYYSKAKILLLTSKFEGLPMCLIEAQQFGCIPVSFDISGGVRDILGNGSGVLVKQNDIEALADKVSELIMDNEHMQELSEKSISNVGRFSIDRIGPMWDNLLAD